MARLQTSASGAAVVPASDPADAVHCESVTSQRVKMAQRAEMSAM